MEIRKGGQVLIGFPALIDKGDAVEIEVFDEPDVAAAKHRAGLRRLVALQIKEPLKYLEKNIPDLQKMAAAYMPLGTLDELRDQIIDVALDRAFLAEPLPTDEAAFKRGWTKGRGRLNLIAQEVARLAGCCWSTLPPPAQAQGQQAAQGRGRRRGGSSCSGWCPSGLWPPRPGRSCSICRAT
jgi:ATP-dependent helicase HrpA